MRPPTLLPLLFLSASTTDAITLTKRSPADGPARVLQLDIRRNTIPDPVAHDDARRTRRHARRDGSVNADIDNQVSLYALNITIGSPAQAFTVNIDTGSSDLWVNSASSRLCRLRQDPCSTSGTYNANASSSYQYVNSQFNISYAGGNAAGGDYATDTVRFAGQTVSDLQFGIGYESSTPLAILGLGYPINEAQSTNADMQPYKNLPAKLTADNVIASNAYSIWLNDLDASTGSLLFGGVDRAQYEGDLVTIPVQSSSGVHAEFFVAMTDVQLDGQSVSDTSNAVAALLDTGTSLTYLPNDVTAAIYQAVGATLDEKEGVGIVACDLAGQNVNMTYRFADSISINVPLNELVLSSLSSSSDSGSLGGGSSACQFGIAPAGSDTVILGDTFLRSAYVVFDIDNNEVSLAQSRFNATRSDIAEIGSGSNAVPSAATATSDVTATSGLPSAPTTTETGTEGAGASVAPSMLGLGVSVFAAAVVGWLL